MIEIYIDLSEVEELAKKYGRGPEIIDKEAMRTMKEGTLLTERLVKLGLEPHQATGMLYSSIYSSVYHIQDGIEGIITAKLPGKRYVEFVEFGTRPHWPPVEPIRFWVLQKLRPPVEEVPGIAFLVGRKISRVGTPARRAFEQGWLEAEPKVMSMFNVMAYKVVEGIER